MLDIINLFIPRPIFQMTESQRERENFEATREKWYIRCREKNEWLYASYQKWNGEDKETMHL